MRPSLRRGYLLGEFHEGTAEPAALGTGVHGDVLDVHVIVAGAEGQHGSEGRAGDPGRAGLDRWPVVAEHRAGGLSIRDRYLAYAASMSALIAGRSPGVARRSPGIAGVLSGVVVVTGRLMDLSTWCCLVDATCDDHRQGQRWQPARLTAPREPPIWASQVERAVDLQAAHNRTFGVADGRAERQSASCYLRLSQARPASHRVLVPDQSPLSSASAIFACPVQ